MTTGPEIIEAVVSTPSTPAHPSSGKVDVLVAGAGTGGTITGISRAIKKTHNKDCVVVGADPVSNPHNSREIDTRTSVLLQRGSILALPAELNNEDEGLAYVVEGIGYDFIPDVLSREANDIDVWIKTSDEDSFPAVQMIMRNEGLLVGGSSGSSLSAALQWLKGDEGRHIAETPGKNVVVVLPDGYVHPVSSSCLHN